MSGGIFPFSPTQSDKSATKITCWKLYGPVRCISAANETFIRWRMTDTRLYNVMQPLLQRVATLPANSIFLYQTRRQPAKAWRGQIHVVPPHYDEDDWYIGASRQQRHTQVVKPAYQVLIPVGLGFFYWDFGFVTFSVIQKRRIEKTEMCVLRTLKKTTYY